MSFTQVALTGTVTLSNATPASGAVVSLTLNTPITDGTQIVAPEPVTTRCASDGTFSVTVNANDDPTTTPTGSYYAVAITYGSQTLDTFNVIVPHADAPTVNLFTLAQLVNPNVALPFVQKIIAGTGVSISPAGGTGSVTVNASGGGASANVVNLGNITGTVTCNLASGTCFTGTLTGNVTINFSNWPAAPALTEPLLILTQDGTGGHSITITGVVWEPTGTPPSFNTAAGTVNVIPLSSPDQGTHLYGSSPAGGTITGINQAGTALIQGQIVSPTPVLQSKTTAIDPTRTTATNAATALTISTPDSSGQTTEPAIIRIPGGWNGHEYWAVITGYTNGAGSTENPALYYSDDGQTFTPVTTATVNGVAGTNIFPIVGQPTGQGANSHNDDPDIVWGPDGKLHLFWIAYLQTPNTTVVYWCTYDGTTLTSPTVLWTDVNTTESPIAPIFMWDGANNQWVCWYTDAANFYNSVNAAYPYKRRTCPGTSPGGTWSTGTTTTLNGGPGGKSIWETHIARRGEQLHIVATFCTIMTGGSGTSLYFGVSNDNGLTWTFNTSPLLVVSASGWDKGIMYRGCLVPLDDGSDGLYELWYSAAGTAGGSNWGTGYTKIYLTPSTTQAQTLMSREYTVPGFLGITAAATAVGTWAASQQSAAYFGGAAQNTDQAQNDVIGWDFELSAGTWSVVIAYAKATTQAIWTVAMDGTSVGTIDAYAASTSWNNIATIGSITISTSGKHRLTFTSAAKNASSTAYQMSLEGFFLYKTA